MTSHLKQNLFYVLSGGVLLVAKVEAHTHAIVGVPSPGFVGQPVNLSLTCPPVPVPGLTDFPAALAVLCLLIVGLVSLWRRGAVGVTLALLMGFALLSSGSVRSDDCGGFIDWSAQSASELFADTGLTFSFTPTAAGIFAVTAETGSETTMASVTVCEVGEVLGVGGDCEPPPTLDYVGSTHTADDCVGAGGTVVAIAGDPNGTETCRFDQASCPVGWSASSNWSTTMGSSTPWSMNHPTFSTTCNGVPFDWPTVFESGSLPSGSHPWSDVAPEMATCSLWNGPPVFQVVGNCSDPLINQVSSESVPPANVCGGISTVSAIVFSNGGIGTLSRWHRSTSPVFANAITAQRGCH